MNGFNDTVWQLSRCDAVGCDEEGTEELNDRYYCPSCYIARMTRTTTEEAFRG